MASIDTNMNIFDSPPAAKQRAPPRPLVPSRDDNDGDVSPDNHNNTKGRTQEEEEEEWFYSNHDTPYEDIIQQANNWTASLNIARDKVFKLQIQAAMTLDVFAMLSPDQEFVQEEEEQEVEQEETEMLMPHSLAETFDKAETTQNQDDVKMRHEDEEQESD